MISVVKKSLIVMMSAMMLFSVPTSLNAYEKKDSQHQSNGMSTFTKLKGGPTLQGYNMQKESTLNLRLTNNAHNFNVLLEDGITPATDGFTFTTSNLVMTKSGNYVIDGFGLEAAQQINFVDGFEGVVTLRNVVIKHEFAAMNIHSTTKLTLLLEGINNLEALNVYNAAIEFNNPTSGYLIIDSYNNGSLHAKSEGIGSAIGGGAGSEGGNITIKGGFINASANGGAAIGGGENAGYTNIKITGGVVSAKSTLGDGIGKGADSVGADPIVISGGSVKSEGVNSFSVAPTSESGDELVLVKLDNQEDIISLIVDDINYRIENNYEGDSSLYLYLKKGTHTVLSNTETANNKYEVVVKDDGISIILENQWILIPSISDWTYGNPVNAVGSSKYGIVDFLYSATETENYTTIKPSEAGNYFMKARVMKTDTYSGLEMIIPFTIRNANAPSTFDTSNGSYFLGLSIIALSTMIYLRNSNRGKKD